MSVNLSHYLEDDILNYSLTVMFRETPSIYQNGNYPYSNKNFNNRTSYSLSYVQHLNIGLVTQIKEQKGYSLTLLNNKIKFVLR